MLRFLQLTMIALICLSIIVSKQEKVLPTYMEGLVVEKGVEKIYFTYHNKKLSLNIYYFILQKTPKHDTRKWYVNDYIHSLHKENDYIKLNEDDLHTAWEQ